MKVKIKTKIFLILAVAFFAVQPLASVFAKQIVITENSESAIMLDVARRYYTVDEIKKYIDALSVNENSTLQVHFTDDENVGIECAYLDQTVANATYADGIYTNPQTGLNFLSYDQVQELMDYADAKKVRFVPEIDMPAHMNGFFNLAEIKWGWDAVRSHENGFAWGTGDEIGNLDIVREQGRNFIFSIYDEYTEFFKSREYFHMGFDEYTFRIDEKIDFANEMYEYLAGKGFKVRMWSDAVTKSNISQLNNNIEIIYWGWWDDIRLYDYATVPDFQEAGFKVIITNRFYLFFVPYQPYMTDEINEHTIRDIEENWELESWNYNFPSTLDNHDNIMGGMVCIWGENSAGVDTTAIREQGVKMYNAMFPKLDVFTRVIDVPDDEPVPDVPNTAADEETIVNPNTSDNTLISSLSLVILSTIGIIAAANIINKQYR